MSNDKLLDPILRGEAKETLKYLRHFNNILLSTEELSHPQKSQLWTANFVNFIHIGTDFHGVLFINQNFDDFLIRLNELLIAELYIDAAAYIKLWIKIKTKPFDDYTISDMAELQNKALIKESRIEIILYLGDVHGSIEYRLMGSKFDTWREKLKQDRELSVLALIGGESTLIAKLKPRARIAEVPGVATGQKFIFDLNLIVTDLDPKSIAISIVNSIGYFAGGRGWKHDLDGPNLPFIKNGLMEHLVGKPLTIHID